MKTKTRIIAIAVTLVIVAAILLRLASNKRDLESEISSNAEFATVIPVETYTVSMKGTDNSFKVNGSVTPLREISAVAEVQGQVTSVSASLGNKVKVNQVLAEVQNELLKAQCEYEKANLEKAKRDLDRFETLSKTNAATSQQFEAARLTYLNAQSTFISVKKQYENTYIRAPFNGIITKRFIEKGSYLTSGQAAFSIAETDKVKFIAKLTVAEAAEIAVHDALDITIDALQGTTYKGKVTAIGVTTDESKRYDIEIEIANSGSGQNMILPGMFGTAIFPGKKNQKNLLIPRRAVTGSMKNPKVFVVTGNSVSEREIVAESVNDAFVRVVSGLQSGEIVVTAGQINLVNGSKVKLLPSSK